MINRNITTELPAERWPAPEPAGIPSGDRSAYSTNEGLK
jgi:hypothetical protein